MDHINIKDDIKNHVIEILGEEAFAKIVLIAFSEAALNELDEPTLKKLAAVTGEIFMDLAYREISKVKLKAKIACTEQQ